MNNLRRKLTESGLSAAEVSRRANISKPDLSNVLHGKRPLYNGWATRIAGVIGCSPTELL